MLDHLPGRLRTKDRRQCLQDIDRYELISSNQYLQLSIR